jgi:uncharacterized iron-regulated protein
MTRLRSIAGWLVLGVLLGCTPAAQPEPLVWSTRLSRDHPLVGKIWDVGVQRFVSEAELVKAITAARFVLLGEKHDNADHHQLQARLIEQLVAQRRRPALVFEMLDVAQQPVVDRARAEHPRDVDALAVAVDWAHSGWPPFSLYRPVFAAAAAAALPIAAAGLDRDAAMRIAREGDAAVDPALVQRFDLAEPLQPDEEAALRAEMREVHCGLLPEQMLGSMVRVQRVRDARMAERMYSAGTRDGSVLIAGAGHARRDRGVPRQLARGYGTDGAAIAFLEAERDWQKPQQYAAEFATDVLPFDYVWFTPRASDEDPCAELRSAHQKP